MRWCAVIALILAAALCLYALGWGQTQPWHRATGWDRLPERLRARVMEKAAFYQADALAPTFFWWGHATMEIHWGGQRIVTDPVAGGRVSLAPRWFDDLILDASREFDLICLTHAHMDHLDNGTLERLPPTRIVLPNGSERFLSEEVRSRHTIIPLNIGETYRLGELEVSPVPARHGGWRYPWQRGLFACGYIVRHDGAAIYLAGDTAMGEHFKSIGADYAPRYAVLPIGAYSPQWFLRSRHLNPDEALDAAAALGADRVIPYHFGTYRLSLEPVDAPLPRFARAAAARGIDWCLPVSDSRLPSTADLAVPVHPLSVHQSAKP